MAETGSTRTMRKITFEEARRIADGKGLVPVIVKGTGDSGLLRFAKLRFGGQMDPRLEATTWEQFESIAWRRGLAVYESAGWMRLMRDR